MVGRNDLASDTTWRFAEKRDAHRRGHGRRDRRRRRARVGFTTSQRGSRGRGTILLPVGRGRGWRRGHWGGPRCTHYGPNADLSTAIGAGHGCPGRHSPHSGDAIRLSFLSTLPETVSLTRTPFSRVDQLVLKRRFLGLCESGSIASICSA